MLYMLFSPASTLPKTGLFDIPHFDKIVHFGMFAVLVFVFRLEADKNSSKKQYVKYSFLLLTLFFAVLSEFIQYKYIQGRTGNFKDFIADLMGYTSGTLFYIWIWKKLASRFVFLQKL
jgi:VanZ family protein